VSGEAIGSREDQRHCQAGPEGIGEGRSRGTPEGTRAAGQGRSAGRPPDQWSSHLLQLSRASQPVMGGYQASCRGGGRRECQCRLAAPVLGEKKSIWVCMSGRCIAV